IGCAASLRPPTGALLGPWSHGRPRPVTCRSKGRSVHCGIDAAAVPALQRRGERWWLMTRVFLVDDHEVVRSGVAGVVDLQPDLQVVGEASSCAEARRRIAAVRPDVAVLDVMLPDGNGIDLCRDIRQSHPEVRCLVLTAFE